MLKTRVGVEFSILRVLCRWEVKHASKHTEVVVAKLRGRCAPVGDDFQSYSVVGTLEGVDTRCRRFLYPSCAEDVRILRSGSVHAPRVRLNCIEAIVYRSLLY